MNNTLEELLNQTREINKRTEILIAAAKTLYGEGGLLSKETLSSFPVYETVNWNNATELGKNILGLRVPSEDSVKFRLKAVYDGKYDDHYHDCTEEITVLDNGELIFYFNDKKVTVKKEDKFILDANVPHIVVVKKGTNFTVDFR